MIKVTSEVSPCEEYYELVNKSINAIINKIKELCLKVQSINNHTDNAPTLVVNDDTQPTRFRQKPNIKMNKLSCNQRKEEKFQLEVNHKVK
ncbi:hypothetical protein CR513_11046, partial [Mucuna pruriens]